MVSQVVQTSDAANMASECTEVGFLPHEVFKTFAKDIDGDLVDVHTFSKFFTFQVDRPKTSDDSKIQTIFQAEKSSGEGFLFRLRAELSSAFSDEVQQGMRVSLLDAVTGAILVDASSIDDNEGAVRLDFPKLEDGQQYAIKYEFFEKQLVSNQDIAETQSSASNTQCRLPFITQELLIIDRRLVKQRILRYNNEEDKRSLGLQDFKCQLGKLNNTVDSPFGEDGLFCDRQTYTYSALQNPMELNKLYEQTFIVRGAKNEIISYWYEMIIGYNFMVGSGLKVLLSRNDIDIDSKESAFRCLYDKTCVLAHMSNKNELKVDLILTSGEYKLTFFDQQSTDVRKYLNQDANLNKIPFTFKLTSYPVIQNEERVNCPYMFLDKYFIQNKFIDGMQGQRFSFNDKIIMNIFNQSQLIEVTAEVDMLMKIKVKEAFGVNANIVLCSDTDCVTSSVHLGTSEILFSSLKKGITYSIEVGYGNSIISMSSFFECPHINMEVSMISEVEAKAIVQDTQCSKKQELDSDEKLNSIFNTLVHQKGSYTFDDHKVIFQQNVDQSSSIEKTMNYEVTSKKFLVDTKMELFIEIFYEPYLQDLELYLVSDDADMVRSHIYKAMPKVDWSLYKGSKTLYVELEPGQYDLKIVQKLPGLTPEMMAYQQKCVQFQLIVIFQENIDRQKLIPSSFNYFGLLGPTGQNFGQMVYHCQDCILEHSAYKTIQFKVTHDDKVDINLDAVIQSDQDQVGVELKELKLDQNTNNTQEIANKLASVEQTGTKKIKIFEGSDEESLSKGKMKSQTNYVLVLVNKDAQTNNKATFNLRVEITEKTYKSSKPYNFREELPKNIEEITRYKVKTEGLKESEFIIGTKFMLDWIDTNRLHPFIPKSDKVYQAKYKDSKNEIFQLALPFTVLEDESEIFAAVYDYTGVANMGVSIIKDSDSEEFEIACIPGKYHSWIEPVTLTKGNYYLVVEPQTDFADEDNSILKFSLDFMYQKENITDKDNEIIFDSMEVCGLPIFPDNFNSPQYLHPLSGNQLQIISHYRINEALLGESIRFEIFESSLISFYMELPKDMQAVAELTKSKGTHKTKASTKDLNQQNDNFLRQKDLTHQNVIEFREFLSPGIYNIKVHASEFEEENVYAMPRCQSFKVGVSIAPTRTALTKSNEMCGAPITLGSKLRFDALVNGTLQYDTNKNIFDTSYINTENQGEGPFFVYFHLNYDTQIEGPLAVLLSKYDQDTLQFEQIGIYEAQDSQSQLVSVVEQGTYVLSIVGLQSTSEKYVLQGLGKTVKKQDVKLFQSPCLTLQYTYFIASVNSNDAKSRNISIMDMISSLFNGDLDLLKGADSEQSIFDKQISNDIKDIGSTKCRYDNFPSSIPLSDSGFDKTYQFKMSKKNFELLDIVTEENALIRVYIRNKNPKNNINAFLYQNSQLNNLVAYTEGKKNSKDFMASLKPQKKAYKLKLVYDSLDETDDCPVYDFRVSIKPIENLIEENLKCSGQQNAPEQVSIVAGDFELDQEYAVSNEFIEKFDKNKDISYDIEINVPNDNYLFDIETRSDFLTTSIDFALFGIDNKNDQVIVLSRSQFVNEENLGDNSALDTTNTYQSKDFVRRLRIRNVQEMLSEGQHLSGKYLLRLKFSKQIAQLVHILKEKGQLTKDNQACFPFDLSIRAIQVKDGSEFDSKSKNELIRIDWSTKLQGQLVDPRQKLTAFLQFENSMEDSYHNIKFQPFVYLVPEGAQVASFERILPVTTRLSMIDKSSIVITFKHNVLERGKCYKLKIETNMLEEKYDESLFVNQTRLCTTNCLCNPKGTKSCDEKLGVCECHYPFIGHDCSQCGFNHVFDPTTQECVKIRKCKENGGDEDCNGHGTCQEDLTTGQAVCECDYGFANDGLDQCSKCSDPMFDYPNCMSRNWILEHPDVNCKDLPLKMPKFLYQKDDTFNDTLQNEEGLLQWFGRYRLAGEKYRKQSTHHFMVKTNSILRFFFDTLESGVKVKYTVLDDNKQIIYSTPNDEAYVEADVVFDLLKQTENHKAKENPFTLQLEYQYDKAALVPGKCPMIDVNLIVQPFTKIQKHLQCTAVELQNAAQDKQFSWTFGSSNQYFNERFTLSSDMVPGKSPYYISEQSENFMTMKYMLKIDQSGNALSIITAYNFESVMLSLTLIDTKNNNNIAIESVSSLEDVQGDDEQISMENDMVSAIELSSIDAGLYELQILVMKALFLPTKNFKTCLNFDFTLEYITRTISQEQESSSGLSYEVISVFPAVLTKIRPTSKGKIDVRFNQDIDIDSFVQSENDLHHICYFENLSEKTKTINPYKISITKANQLTLFFNFKSAKIPESNNCYKLRCTTTNTIGKEIIKPILVDTNYCITNGNSPFDVTQCNPYAFPKYVDNKCVCTYPYTGTNCELCEPGYNQNKEKRVGKHTVCVLDEDLCSSDICNNHGSCLKDPGHAKPTDRICSCDEKYDGQFCEKCKNSTLAYPDCDEIASDIYDEVVDKEFLNRRKYNCDGYERFNKDNNKPQCSWANYPKDLNKVELMGFVNGAFHIADHYTINHDQDNLIYFTPQTQGTFKIFIQQPEAEELQVNDETFDIEIGLYDVTQEKFVAASMNNHVDLQIPSISGKLEYSSLTFQVPHDSINKPFIVMFRALNFSMSSQEAQCEMVYLEIEFRESPRECKYERPPVKAYEVTKITPETPYKMDDSKTYSIYNDKSTFFYYQDFYFEDGVDNDNEYEIKISIQQKFIEKNLIDFALEVLQSDVDYLYLAEQYHYSYDNPKPECNGICLFSGQKAYNEFHNVVQMSARTYFRLWLFQTETDGSCANFQLSVEANKISDTKASDQLANLKCEELDLPKTLNTARYLGDKSNNQKQQSFHYLERFRVDNLRNSSYHRIEFDLQEPALVRFAAPVHKHIEFDMELREVKIENGKTLSKKIILSNAKDFEDQIFAQLDAGSYQLKLLFVSDAFYITQPCQSVALELAMTSLSQVKAFQQQQQRLEQVDFSLEGIIYSPTRSLMVQKQDAVTTFQITDNQQLRNYESYTQLYQKKFFIPNEMNIGAMITITSDFLLNDINFALTHLPTQTVLRNVKRENLNKLVVDNLQGGQYELIIFTHQCLTNLKSGFLEHMNVKYLVDFNFIRWSHQDDFKKHYITFKVGESQLRAEADTVDKNEEKCYTDYQMLPEELKSFGLGGIDMSSYFMIPQTETYEHTMTYEPTDDLDALRFIIERPNTKVRIFKNEKDTEPIAESYGVLRGQAQVLVATELRKGTQYSINFEFNPQENFEEEENTYCEPFKLSIWATTSRNICLRGLDEYVPYSIVLKKGSTDVVSTLITQTQSTLIQTLTVEDDTADIEVTYDFTNILYPPMFKLAKKFTKRMELKKDDIKKAVGQEIKPTEIVTDIKNQVKFKFSKLKKGDYQFIIFQAQKPKDCANQYIVNIQTSKPADTVALLEKEVFGMIKTYVSEQEIQDINRYVESLPVSLDTYKYMKDEPYMLVSEYIQISDVKQNNRIHFTINKNGTFFKLYIENDEFLLTLKERSSGKSVQDFKSTAMMGKLNIGTYDLEFDFYTEMQRKKYSIGKNKVHLTIMISEQDYFNNTYVKRHGKNLENCDKSVNFPLALNKDSSQSVTELEAVYDYPLLRLSPEVLKSKFIIDSYSFRVNETSRFYMAVGMHMIANQVVLQLSDLKNFGNSYIGKQEFNLNVLDVTLSPGDYGLMIDQPQMFDKNGNDFCGIFSFYSKITPLNEMTGTHGEMVQNKCEMKEVLPAKIYSSEEATKSGLEFFINSEGTFYRGFENVLIKKSRYSQFNPEFDRMQFAPREDAIFSILLQYKQKGNNPIVKLYDSFAFTDVENTIVDTFNEASNTIVERSITYRLAKDHEYTLFVYYQGELTYDQDGQEECEYYNVHIAINHLSYLNKELQCIEDSKVAKSMIKDLPDKITDSDFGNKDEYRFKELLQIQYPLDFDDLADYDDKNLLLKTVNIQVSDNFNLETYTKYDFPYSSLDLSLFDEQIQADQNSQLEDVAQQLPIYSDQGSAFEQTLVRQLQSNDQKAKKNYLLAIQDESARKIFDYLFQYNAKTSKKQNPLCLYVEVGLTLTKIKSNKVISGYKQPLITAVNPKMPGKNIIELENTIKELSVSVKFNTIPMSRNQIENHESGIVPEAQMADMVMLQFVSGQSGEVFYSRKPIRIQKDQKGLIWNFVFDIKEDQTKKNAGVHAYFYVDLINLMDSQGKPFNFKDGVQFPVFALQNAMTFNEKKQQSENHESTIHQTKAKQEEQIQKKEGKMVKDEVKCLCVHGKCAQGSSQCLKCDEGWEGKLCDIKTRPKNINNNEGESRNKRDNKMSRDRKSYENVPFKKDTERNEQPTYFKEEPVTKQDQSYEYIKKMQNQDAIRTNQIIKQQKEEDSVSFFDNIYQFFVTFIVVGVVIGGAYWVLTKGRKMKDYIPVALNEDSDGSPRQMLELSEIRPKKQVSSIKKRKSPEQHKQEVVDDTPKSLTEYEDDDEDETKKLTNELMLYADLSEQDQAQMIANQSPEGRRYDDEQPQHLNEADTVNEIDDMLRDMGDQEEDEHDDDEHSELKRFF